MPTFIHPPLPHLNMFGLFKSNPVEKMRKQYMKLMEQAMQLQRNGDIKGYAVKMEEAEALMKQIEAAEKK